MLDQVAFQAQGLQVGVAQQHVEIGDVGNHRRHLGGVPGIAEIGTHAVFQIDRLADVDDGALRVLHQVAAGAFRQLGDFQLQVFTPVDFPHGHHLLLSLL